MEEENYYHQEWQSPRGKTGQNWGSPTSEEYPMRWEQQQWEAQEQWKRHESWKEQQRKQREQYSTLDTRYTPYKSTEQDWGADNGGYPTEHI